jgi:DNA-binding NarL/FixJ family response regulator
MAFERCCTPITTASDWSRATETLSAIHLFNAGKENAFADRRRGLRRLRSGSQSRRTATGLILLDVGLPSLNGIEAARQIRKLSPQVQKLFVSQESSAEVVEEALLLGAR